MVRRYLVPAQSSGSRYTAVNVDPRYLYKCRAFVTQVFSTPKSHAPETFAYIDSDDVHGLLSIGYNADTDREAYVIDVIGPGDAFSAVSVKYGSSPAGAFTGTPADVFTGEIVYG